MEHERTATEAWLKNHDIFPEAVYMRKKGDFRPDYELKQDILNQLLADGHEILLVVDDRKQVVEMWRRNGIMCLQCAEGDF
jgi:hypothetical protein